MKVDSYESEYTYEKPMIDEANRLTTETNMFMNKYQRFNRILLVIII